MVVIRVALTNPVEQNSKKEEKGMTASRWDKTAARDSHELQFGHVEEPAVVVLRSSSAQNVEVSINDPLHCKTTHRIRKLDREGKFRALVLSQPPQEP